MLLSPKLYVMDLQIKDQLFIVCGASGGFGRAVSELLVLEGAQVIAVARNEQNLQLFAAKTPGQVTSLSCDITQPGSIGKVLEAVNNRQVHGVLVNAGGPPAMAAMETKLEDWDNAYKTLLRWKIDLTQRLVPAMIESKYGRFVYIESASVKQPIENLALSNSIRLAVVGYIKTLSQEISKHGVNLNVLAPGFHYTGALDRIINKNRDLHGMTDEDSLKQFASQTSVKRVGKPEDFASLALWLLSPHSRYITGQTISVDGGSIRGVMG
jgi:3-oxoacyl-[acyl-carrier protein] reductase